MKEEPGGGEIQENKKMVKGQIRQCTWCMGRHSQNGVTKTGRRRHGCVTKVQMDTRGAIARQECPEATRGPQAKTRGSRVDKRLATMHCVVSWAARREVSLSGVHCRLRVEDKDEGSRSRPKPGRRRRGGKWRRPEPCRSRGKEETRMGDAPGVK